MDELIGRGKEMDRLIIAFEAIRAFMAGKDEVLAEQASVYSESFIEYGMLSLAGGLLFSTEQAQERLAKLREIFPQEASKSRISIIRVLDLLDRDESYAFMVNKTPIDPDHHREMVSVVLAIGGMVADLQDEGLETLLDRVQLGLIEHHLDEGY